MKTMARAELTARKRIETGKNAARRLRQDDLIPANLVVPHSESMMLAIGRREFENFLLHNNPNTIIDFSIGDGKNQIKKSVLVREIQRDFLKHRLLHIDFQEIKMDQKIQVRVQVRLEGAPVGVVENSGNLNQVINELDIECLPGNIPGHVSVDVSGLDIHQHVCISNIEQTGDFRILLDPDTVVATVLPPRVVKEEIAEETEMETAEAEEETAPTDQE